MKDIELYWNDDHTKYAVLVSYGFGAGFSSWSKEEFAYDKRIVEFWLAHKNDEDWMCTVNDWGLSKNFPESDAHKEAKAFFHSIGHECPYLGGFKDIELEWAPRDARWIIEEYDGAESLRFRNDIDWNYID